MAFFRRLIDQDRTRIPQRNEMTDHKQFRAKCQLHSHFVTA